MGYPKVVRDFVHDGHTHLLAEVFLTRDLELMTALVDDNLTAVRTYGFRRTPGTPAPAGAEGIVSVSGWVVLYYKGDVSQDGTELLRDRCNCLVHQGVKVCGGKPWRDVNLGRRQELLLQRTPVAAQHNASYG